MLAIEFLSWFFNGCRHTKPSELPLEQIIEQAKQDWYLAQEVFRTSPDDCDLIDSASYMILATERRYMHFLKRARREKFHYSPYSSVEL